MKRSFTYLIALILAALALPRTLPAQMVPDTVSRATIIPYFGIEYARMMSRDLNALLIRTGSTHLYEESTFNSLVVGVLYMLTIRDLSLGYGIEYSSNSFSQRGGWQQTEIRMRSLKALVGIPISLGSNWSASFALGMANGWTTVRLSPISDTVPSSIDSALMRPTGSLREMVGNDTRLSALASLGYAIPISSDSIQTHFLGLSLRAGTEFPIIRKGWSVDGESVDSGPMAPSRPLFIDLIVSFFTRDGSR